MATPESRTRSHAGCLPGSRGPLVPSWEAIWRNVQPLQNNEHDWTVDHMKRIGLRYTRPDASREEIRQVLAGLKQFKTDAELFFGVVDATPITAGFIDDAMAHLG